MPRFLAALCFTSMITLALNGCAGPKTQGAKPLSPSTSEESAGLAESKELPEESEWANLELQFRNDPGTLTREQLLQLYRWRRESQAKIKERNKRPVKPTTNKIREAKKLSPKSDALQPEIINARPQDIETREIELPKVETTPSLVATPTPIPTPVAESDPEETIMADQRMRLHCSRFGTLQKPEQTENCLKRAMPIWQNCQQRATKADRLSCLKKALP